MTTPAPVSPLGRPPVQADPTIQLHIVAEPGQLSLTATLDGHQHLSCWNLADTDALAAQLDLTLGQLGARIAQHVHERLAEQHG